MLPIYDEIISQMDGTESGLEQTHCATITRLDQDHLNIIYLLILHHYLTFGAIPGTRCITKTRDLPYGAKSISNGKGVSFKKVSQLPVEIQKIIQRYLIIVSK